VSNLAFPNGVSQVFSSLLYVGRAVMSVSPSSTVVVAGLMAISSHSIFPDPRLNTCVVAALNVSSTGSPSWLRK
jgi:hypothetical protein